MRVMPLHGASLAVAAIITSASITLVTLVGTDKDANAPFQVAGPPSQPPTPVDYQSRSNSVPWDQDPWKPWIIELREDDDTRLTGYNTHDRHKSDCQGGSDQTLNA